MESETLNVIQMLLSFKKVLHKKLTVMVGVGS